MLLTHSLHTSMLGMAHTFDAKIYYYNSLRESNRITKDNTYVVKIPWPTTLSSRMELLEMINFGTLVYKL